MRIVCLVSECSDFCVLVFFFPPPLLGKSCCILEHFASGFFLFFGVQSLSMHPLHVDSDCGGEQRLL